MSLSARHSGKIGDAVMAIPAMKALGITDLYLPERTGECNSLFSSLKRLMELQGFNVKEYTSGLAYGRLDPRVPVNFDFDKARNQPKRGVTHLVLRYLNTFNIQLDNWKDPWLIIDNVKPIKEEYVVINYTGRHLMNDYLGIRSRVDWTKVYHSIPDKKYFIGTKEEHTFFCNNFAYVDWFETTDMLDVARVVNGAAKVYCNQSSVMAIASSLGKEMYCDFKPQKDNCKLFTDNEHEL